MEEKGAVFRDRTESVDHPLKSKRLRRNSSDKSEDNMEEAETN